MRTTRYPIRCLSVYCASRLKRAVCRYGCFRMKYFNSVSEICHLLSEMELQSIMYGAITLAICLVYDNFDDDN